MYCVCYACSKQYRAKPPIDDPHISHGICGGWFPGEILRMKIGTEAFMTSGERRLFSERNRYLPKGFDAPDRV
jgi:hypothetical protein